MSLERYTAVQREDEKRTRVLERQSGLSSAVNAGLANGNGSAPQNLVRTKTPTPIRHTVWKTRGEEYRRLGGSGWTWISATRRPQPIPRKTSAQLKTCPTPLPMYFLVRPVALLTDNICYL